MSELIDAAFSRGLSTSFTSGSSYRVRSYATKSMSHPRPCAQVRWRAFPRSGTSGFPTVTLLYDAERVSGFLAGTTAASGMEKWFSVSFMEPSSPEMSV